uniref:Uncharacterized protein n=1 Tax=Opuntia streptacantha TaxID=393608 RepID=A0A7C9DMT3_OPUST
MASGWSCHFHSCLPVLFGRPYPDLRRLCRRSAARLRLRRKFRHRQPGIWRHAWNEQCIGDTLWASIWCRQAQHVRDIHAEVVDHLASYFVSAYSTVYLFSTNSSAFWRN